MKLVKNQKKYYEFIRLLRTDEENISGFLEKSGITPEQQLQYMAMHKDHYYICVDENTVAKGWVGVVENDIRLCVDNNYKNKGIGKFMINEISKLYPLAHAKVLLDNKPSNMLFQSCGFDNYKSDSNFSYYRKVSGVERSAF